MLSRKIGLAVLLFLLVAVTLAMYVYGRALWVPAYHRLTGKQTVPDVVRIHGDSARERMRPFFNSAGASYPPDKITLLAIKDTHTLELWVEADNGPIFIRSYPIQALSGTSGPKLREGDRQVPEGLYSIEGLNPNSAYHLSMKLNYPNAFDLDQAAQGGRKNPGTNIFIHGKAVSIGCLAMGDSAIEELFVLAADSGISNIRVAIAPSDPRQEPLPDTVKPAWVSDLYTQLNSYFLRYTHE